jgi:hypothetical protein
VFPKPGHKAAEGHEASHEPLNILDIPDLAYFRDGQNLVGVHFNAALVDDVPQELPQGTLKVHFSGFRLMLNHQRMQNISSRLAMRLLLFCDFTMMSMT